MKIDKTVAMYIEARDMLAEMKREYEESIKPLKVQMEKLEKKMLGELNKAGVDSMKTSEGTVYKSTGSSCTVADWDTVFDFMKEKDMWQMLNHSVNKTAVTEYLEANGELPPGVNYTTFTTVNFRRS